MILELEPAKTEVLRVAESLPLSAARYGTRLCLREAEIPMFINVECLSSRSFYILDGKKR